MRFKELIDVLNYERVRGDFSKALDLFRGGNRIFFIGNGGSAAIASHMAADWLKNGKRDARAFNDPAAITCLTNDLGYHVVFVEQLRATAVHRDLLVAISSSGESPNILRAVDWASTIGMRIISLSGFKPDNSLSKRGDVQFYVPSMKYGIVEVAHHAILHSILDQYISGETP